MRSRAITVVLLMLCGQPAFADDDEEPDPDDSGEEEPNNKGDGWKRRDVDADEAKPEQPDDEKPEALPAPKKKAKGGGEVVGVATLDHDITPPRVTFAGELLGAAPLDGGNRDLFGNGGGASAGAEVWLSPLVGIHGGLTMIYVAKGEGMESTSWVAGHVGPRVHFGPQLFGAATHHDAWVDAHATYGSSGGIRRPGFDLGGAVQWEVSPQFRVGPMVRYQFGSDPLDKNAQVFTLGIAVGYGGRTRTPVHVIGDRDGDGLADNVDTCPDEHHGDKPDKKRAGCPAPPEKVVLDADQDGVPDDDDWCPRIAQGETPLKGQPGCPSKTLARVVDKKIEILQQIFFETDKATIKDESLPVLEAVAGVMKQLGDKQIRIEGHTDDQGDDAYNLDLSKRRARAVAQWLVSSGGIDQARLVTEGYGKSRPLVDGPNADQSMNRRVEFVILDK